MANFTEKQIQQMMFTLKWDFGVENSTRELAILELEDLKRKGCTLENIGDCHGCSARTKENSYCPLADWEKRHPEYRDDELAIRIKLLEAGGEEAYKEKQKHIEEAKKKTEEAKQKIQSLKKTIDATVIKIRNEIGDDKEWWKELDKNIEAYVQARINEKS